LIRVFRGYTRRALFYFFYSRFMYSLNRAQLIGNVTVDPEVRALPNGQRVANFSLATNRRYTDSDGVQQDVPEYHNVVMFGKIAEIAEQYIHK